MRNIIIVIVIIVILGGGYFLLSDRPGTVPEDSEVTTGDTTMETDSIPQEKTNFIVDIENSSLNWEAKKILFGHVGTVNIKSGNVTTENGLITGGEFVLDLTTITESNDNERFLNDIRSANFFEVETYPEAKFVITSADVLASGAVSVVADLTIKDITNSITFPVEASLKGDTATAKASIVIDRTEWNIITLSPNFFEELGEQAVDDEVSFKIDMVLMKDNLAMDDKDSEDDMERIDDEALDAMGKDSDQ